MSAEPTDPRLAYQAMVGAFRAPVHHRPLPAREQLLVGLIAATLVFATLAIGLRDFWAQCVALVLAAGAFLVAVTRSAEPSSPDILARRSGFARLLRFPIFWIGLAVLGYIAVQASNPAYEYREDALSWYLEAIPHQQNLPTSNRTPLGLVEGTTIPHTNAWAYLVLLGGPWLLTCAIWTGLSRRHSCQILAWVILGIALVVVILAVAQRLGGAEAIYWFYEVPNAFWGPFSYRNWAASFLGLCGAVSIGLALSYARERLFSARGRNPVAILLLLSMLILVGAVLSGSRAGLIWAVGLTLFALVPGILLFRRADPAAGVIVPGAILAVLAGALAVVSIGVLQPKGWPERVAVLFTDRDPSAYGRRVLNEASFELTKREPWTGIGAGGYRYHFPSVQAEHPLLAEHDAKYGSSFVRDAHNDWLQYWIELGWIGAGLFVLMPLWWAWTYWRLRAWRTQFSLLCMVGLGFAGLHAFGEFIWQNGVLLMLFGMVAALGALWRMIEILAAGRRNEEERSAAQKRVSASSS